MKKKEAATPTAIGPSSTPASARKDFAISSLLASSVHAPQTPISATPALSAAKFKPRAGVAAPFKSPLIRSSGGPHLASPSPSSTPSFSSRQTIIALEQRLQLLKQAHKIKSEGSIAKLEQLTVKWTQVARSAAEDLWQLVRDAGSVGGVKDDAGRADDWGYAGEKSKQKEADRNWGWDVEDEDARHDEECYPVDDDDESKDEKTEEKMNEWDLGSMLASMGIPPESLGWNAEEGEFVDNS